MKTPLAPHIQKNHGEYNASAQKISQAIPQMIRTMGRGVGGCGPARGTGARASGFHLSEYRYLNSRYSQTANSSVTPAGMMIPASNTSRPRASRIVPAGDVP